jgi:hypothetical protein
MQALSIKQPWATLIAQGYKKIENRTWVTSYRGPLLIHASKGGDPDFYEGAGEKQMLRLDAWLAYLAQHDLDARNTLLADPLFYPRGGVIGVADLTGIVDKSDDTWFCGPHGWVLENARPLLFYPCKGALWLFGVPNEALVHTL